MRGMMVMTYSMFVLLSAIPFVPGAEIGFGFLFTFGAQGALLVYSGMVMALSLAFIIGRFVPTNWVCKVLGAVGLKRARDLVKEASTLTRNERVLYFAKHAPKKWVPFLLRHRYIAMALLLNMPGNFVLGGGGGLAFAAGASRLFGVVPFFVSIAVAVAPFPLAFMLFGWGG